VRRQVNLEKVAQVHTFVLGLNVYAEHVGRASPLGRLNKRARSAGRFDYGARLEVANQSCNLAD
jgi:hypothetical protein